MTPESPPHGFERVTESRRIHEGRIVNLREDTVDLADGRSALREVVEHAQVVAIVPVDDEGNVLLARQYRLPAENALLEIPAGGIDDGESIKDAAQRELQEETGYRAERLDRLSGFFVAPGYCTEFIHLLLATGLSENAIACDEDEDIVVERLPLAQAVGLIAKGEIRDAKSIIGLLLADRQRMESE